MKFKNIEVAGIRRIVFNQSTLWERGEDGSWLTLNGIKPRQRKHEEMMKIVNMLKEDRRFRMWIHGETLNIERKHRAVAVEVWKCVVCGKCSEKRHYHTIEEAMRRID